MPTSTDPILTVYLGWDGYQTSILHALEPLTPDQLNFRPAPNLRSPGEVIRHIALGRVAWLDRLKAPGIQHLTNLITTWDYDPHGNRYIQEAQVVPAHDKPALTDWLQKSWAVLETAITTWTIADLSLTYRHVWRGNTYAVSRQWTLWRLMAHDIHHGGELSLLLGLQGLEPFELGALGGHITEPTLESVAGANT